MACKRAGRIPRTTTKASNMFDIDVPTGGGTEGPFVQWQAKESLDGSIPGRSWSIRNAEGKTVFKGFETGVALDVHNMRTGWCYSTGAKGVAPEWLWNASIRKFAPQPPDRGSADHRWQKGMSIPLAYGPNPTDRAVWEQAQAGAWQAFGQLVELLRKAGDVGHTLPIVKMAGVEKIESKKGVTFAPKFEIVKWVPRPPALMADGIDTGDSAPPPPPPRPAASEAAPW
jgi:hypothetical protein